LPTTRTIIKLFGTVLFSGLFLHLNQAHAQFEWASYDWQTKRAKHGIKVQVSKVTGSNVKAVRAEIVVEGAVPELVALLKDFAYCSKWVDLCKESRVVKQLSTYEEIVYVYNDAPFPIKDRDVVVRSVWSEDQDTGRVSMHSRALDFNESTNLVPVNKKALRLSAAVSEWHFTPIATGGVLVESVAHVDPGGATPAWLINMMLVNSPFSTMQNLRSTIESGRYTSAVDIPF